MTGSTAASRVTDRSIRKFNPGTFQSDEDVIEQFVVRGGELGVVLDVLRGNIDSPSCQHVLVVAPRGRGKTMLLARVAAELRTAGALSECLLPVRFMEESHEIFNLADFWLETLFHLAREAAAHDPEIARDLHETRAALVGRWNEQGLDEHARAAVLAAADRLGRRLVLMVENMQALCRNVDDDFGWQLRQVLQSEPQIMLLASAASRFKGLDDAEQPFFELFRIVDLEPLTTADCRCLWRAVSGDAVTDREIRPLEILTGGSPRLLVIVAGFARHRSLRQLMEELVTLIDEHTEYFRGHLEVLGKAERRVYLAVIDLWQPSRPGEIAARARMDLRVVSTMLGRLVNRGAVITEGRGKKRLYSAAERLYSVYYKLRRERDEAAVVRNLIHFMVAFYSEAELFELSNRLVSEAAASTAIRAGIDRALVEIQSADGRRASTARVLEQIASEVTENYQRQVKRRIDAAAREEAFERVIEIANDALAHEAGSFRVPAALEAYLLHQKAAAYQELNRWAAAIAACDEIIARFGGSDEPTRQWLVAEALVDRGNAKAGLGDREAAIAAYDDVVARFGRSHASHLQLTVAEALGRRANACRQCGDREAAISAYNEVIARFGNSDDSDLKWRVADALEGKGEISAEHGDWDDALAAYEEIVARFGESDDPDLRWPVASALAGRGHTYRKRGNHAAAMVAYDEVVHRFGDSDDTDLDWQIANALIWRGNASVELGDSKAALAAYRQVIARFEDSSDSHLQSQVAAALMGSGIACLGCGEWETAIAAYDELVSQYGDSDEPGLQRWVAMALVIKGTRQVELGRTDEVLHSSKEIERRLGTADDEIGLRWQALSMRVQVLLARGEPDHAMEAFRSAYAAFEPGDNGLIQGMLRLVFNLISGGATARAIVDVLSSDGTKAGMLAPLVVALREYRGEKVRAPDEIRKVAGDVRRRIEAGVK